MASLLHAFLSGCIHCILKVWEGKEICFCKLNRPDKSSCCPSSVMSFIIQRDQSYESLEIMAALEGIEA